MKSQFQILKEIINNKKYDHESVSIKFLRTILDESEEKYIGQENTYCSMIDDIKNECLGI